MLPYGCGKSTYCSSKKYRIPHRRYFLLAQRGSLVILYKQNNEMFEQQPIGHTDDDISFLSELGTTKVTFERAE